MQFSWFALLVVVALTDATLNPLQLQIEIPPSAPSTVSDIIDRAYPGFAMAQHAFQEYAGNLSHPNIFSRNLIDTIAERTGTAVHIRVGGTSGDKAAYVPTQNTSIVLPSGAKPGSIPDGITLGPAWYEGFASFPGVQWTYMAHLALNGTDAENNAIAATREALKYIRHDLEALEVGNEVDLFPGRVRPANYSVEDYIREWKNYTTAINDQVLAGTEYADSRIFQAPVYANHRAPWLVSTTFEEGINNGNNIKSAALHHYQETGNYTTITRQGSFMNHTAIVSNLSYYSQPVEWLKVNHPDIPLYLAETNSDTFSTNDTDLIGVFGSALWLADYMLYGMTLNIRRMNIQLSSGFDYTSWRPVEYYGAPAAVLPPYYAQVYVADLIGTKSDIKISSIDLGLDTLSAYGVYDGKTDGLVKVALINLEDWNTTSTDSRPATKVQFSVPGKGRWRVERLTAPGANSLTDITWAGTSWSYESNGKPVQVSGETTYASVKEGEVSVKIQASEALLLSVC